MAIYLIFTLDTEFICDKSLQFGTHSESAYRLSTRDGTPNQTTTADYFSMNILLEVYLGIRKSILQLVKVNQHFKREKNNKFFIHGRKTPQGSQIKDLKRSPPSNGCNSLFWGTIPHSEGTFLHIYCNSPNQCIVQIKSIRTKK